MIDETLLQNEWVSLKRIVAPEKGVRGYVYSHETRCNGIIVSILPYRIVPDKTKEPKLLSIKKGIGNMIYPPKYEFLLKSEVTPCWDVDVPIPSSITGGFEGMSPSDDAIRELKEETGYDMETSDLIYLGTSRASKSSDTIYSLYSINLTNKKQGEALGDGSRLESEAKAIWVEYPELLKCVDPQVSVIYLRLKEKYL